MPTLRDLIKDLESTSDDLAIFATETEASGWEVDGPAALVLVEDMDDAIGLKMEDLTYFLEIFIAKDVLESYKEVDGGELSEERRIEVLAYYATNDAYIA